jgi:hypothetical protein
MSCSFEERLLLLQSTDNKPQEFNSNIEEYISSLITNSSNAVPIPIRKNNTAIAKKISLIEIVKKIYKILKKESYGGILQKFVNNFPFISFIIFTKKTLKTSANTYFKINRNKYSSEQSDFNIASYKFFLILLRIKLFFKKQSYQKKALKDIPDSKFIYFACPAQPEATTLPSALELRRVSVTLKMLSEALPENVRILYKENPVVFTLRNPYISGSDSLKHKYYESLLEIEKIDFIDINTSTLELIEKSIGVAAINGTAPIEAAIKKKLAITLAPNWYDGVNGVFKCRSVDDMRKVIDQMLEQTEIETNIFSLPFNQDVLIEINKKRHQPYEYDENIQDKIPLLFYNALNIFKSLDDRRWKI